MDQTAPRAATAACRAHRLRFQGPLQQWADQSHSRHGPISAGPLPRGVFPERIAHTACQSASLADGDFRSQKTLFRICRVLTQCVARAI